MLQWLVHALNPIRPLCDEWCLHVWEVVGIWFTGFATFAAVLTSLWLAAGQTRPQVRLAAMKRVLISGVTKGTPSVQVSDFPTVLVVEVTNVGMAPVKIVSVWWSVHIPRPLRWVGFRRRGGLLQNPPDESNRSHGLPATLGSAETLQWVLDYKHLSQEIATKLLAPSLLWPLRLRFFRVYVSTSVGVTIQGRIDQEMSADLRKRTRAIRLS
jgi:hypothetical protein